jgi:hypothetical protein
VAMSRARLLLALPVIAFACADSTSSNPARVHYAGTLDVDIRGSVDVVLAQSGDQAIDVTLSGWKDGYGLFDPGAPLTATGRIDRFPESPGWEVYSARFATREPVLTGPCGAQSVSLVVSLARRDGNARVAGSVTAYCGADQYAGIPARVFRVTGLAGRT